MPFLASCARLSHRLPVSRTKVRAGRVLAAVGARLGASPLCVTELNDGSVVELDARSRTESSALWNGCYDPDLQLVLAELAGVFGGCLYDVGANVGLVGVPLARRLGQGGHVYFFEPVAENVARLRKNIDLNRCGNCTVYEVALGSESGRTHIAREDAFGAATGNAVIVTDDSGLPMYRAISEVSVERLDSIVDSDTLRLPDLIKVDIEGSEINFMKGATRTIARARPIIVGEFNSGLMPRFGTTFLDVMDLLPSGYKVFAFTSALEIVERKAEVGLGNVLLVPGEKVCALPLKVHSRAR